MLLELRIRDYAVVEDLVLSPGPGLNALTGETGAGKSIVVGALSLLLGERASSGVVRAGASRALIEAVFDISSLPEVRARMEEMGLADEEGLLILRREVAAEGRNRAWVNGSPATASAVGALGALLVDLHGQHEHQTLIRPTAQREILDAFAGAEAKVRRVEAAYARAQEIREKLETLEGRRRELESRVDFLRFQLAEIEGARLAPGEDEALEAEARRLSHAQELAGGARELHEALYAGDDSVVDGLARVRSLLQRLTEMDPDLSGEKDALEEIYHLAADVGRRLGAYAEGVEHDPARLEEIRARLDLLFRLKRKYGPELADVLTTGQRVREELAELEEADHDRGELEDALERAREELEAGATELSVVRRDAAVRLGGEVTRLLPELGFPGGTFHVRLQEAGRIGPFGAETVSFLVAPNPGFEPMPLGRIASGGELSRVMLALKAILAGVDRVPVLVFDEIDAGIGGAVGGAVARTLAGVALRHQVLVVSHLPQIAARAGTHFMVEKAQEAGRTATVLRLLEGAERVKEIARMLGGDPDSSVSREHARELLELAGS